MPILINNKQLHQFVFPGGEVSIELPLGIRPPFEVVARLQSSDDILALFQAKDALVRHYNAGIDTLKVPYLPYARQDRVCNNGEALSREVMFSLLGSVNPNRILVVDPHSPGLPPGWGYIPKSGLGLDSLFKTNAVLCAPDIGATEEVKELATKLGLGYLQGFKKRDTLTGKLSGFGVLGGDLSGKEVWIVDDICDAGGTFLGLHPHIAALNPNSINLFTTHGIYSKGLEVLCKTFNKVVSTDTYYHGKDTPDNYSVLEVIHV